MHSRTQHRGIQPGSRDGEHSNPKSSILKRPLPTSRPGGGGCPVAKGRQGKADGNCRKQLKNKIVFNRPNNCKINYYPYIRFKLFYNCKPKNTLHPTHLASENKKNKQIPENPLVDDISITDFLFHVIGISYATFVPFYLPYHANDVLHYAISLHGHYQSINRIGRGQS